MNSRRNFLKNLPFLSAAVLVPGFDVKKRHDPLYPLEYKGYKLRFTGWKDDMHSDLLVGQWLAYPIAPHLVNRMNNGEAMQIYCSFPGIVGYYRPGYVFDICCQNLDEFGRTRQQPLTPRSTKQERDDAEAEQLRRLLTFINGEDGYLADNATSPYARGGDFKQKVNS